MSLFVTLRLIHIYIHLQNIYGQVLSVKQQLFYKSALHLPFFPAWIGFNGVWRGECLTLLSLSVLRSGAFEGLNTWVAHLNLIAPVIQLADEAIMLS